MQKLKPKTSLTPCRFAPGYYQVPGKPYSVDEFGNLLCYDSLSFPTVVERMYGDYKMYRGENIHRLVAETFLDKSHIPEDEAALVNHLNGKRWDNRVKNLEWTTYSGNINHAYDLKLRDDAFAVKTMDVTTGEILKFRSYGQCGRHFGVNQSKVHNYLRRSAKFKESFFLEKYLLVWDKDPFPTEQEYSSWRKSLLSRELAVTDTLEKKTYLFNSTNDAGKFIGVSGSFVQRKLGDLRKTDGEYTTIRHFTIRPMDKLLDKLEDGFEDRRTPVNRVPNGTRRPLPVRVTDLLTNEVKIYNNITEFAESIGSNKAAVAARIYRTDGKIAGRYSVEYIKKIV